MMLNTRDDIEFELDRLNTRLAQRDLYLNLSIVGGTSLIMNGLMSYETDDISNSDAIQSEIKELLDDLSIDINDDFERDYRNNYDGREFLVENDMMFSNIAIEYLSIHDAILTKMQNIDDDDKMRSLVIALEQDYKIKELSLEQITNLLDEFGYEPSDEDIEIINDFINAYNENELFDDLW